MENKAEALEIINAFKAKISKACGRKTKFAQVIIDGVLNDNFKIRTHLQMRGNQSAHEDCRGEIENILTFLGYRFGHLGNDAPRGGKAGNFIRLVPNDELDEVRNAQIKYELCLKIERELEVQAQKQKLKNEENIVTEFFTKYPDLHEKYKNLYDNADEYTCRKWINEIKLNDPILNSIKTDRIISTLIFIK